MSEKRQFLQRQIWYVKRGDAVEGPYPAGLISRYILVGRIKPEDQLSVDGRIWETVASFPELTPDVLEFDQEDPEAQQRLLAAIRWEDERTGRDRRDTEQEAQADEEAKRRGVQRRESDAAEDKAAREARLRRMEKNAREWWAEQASAQSRYRWQSATVIVIAILGGIIGLMYIRPPDLGKPIDCSAPPHAGVNWSLCPMEGRQLQGVDLTKAELRSVVLLGADLSGASLQNANASYAVMSSANLNGVNFRGAQLKGVGFRNSRLVGAAFDNADLAYADFAGADLSGATFAGAVLDKAIWFDRRVCAQGSLGQCN